MDIQVLKYLDTAVPLNKLDIAYIGFFIFDKIFWSFVKRLSSFGHTTPYQLPLDDLFLARTITSYIFFKIR